MARVTVESLGKDIPEGIGRLSLQDNALGMPLPKPKRSLVVVRVHAAAVNFPDLLMTCGGYQYKPKLPYTPGTEACGVIVAVGEGVQGLAPGDRVMVGLREGCMQSVLVAPAAACTLLPLGLSSVEGAAFLVAYTTAYHCLVERAGARAGDAVLVNGATGGVGLAAVQIAKAVGCRHIIATGSTAEKLAVVREYGATQCVDLTDPSTPASKLGEMLKAATGGRGVNIIYDPVGGEVFDASLRGAAWGARVLIVGFAGGVRSGTTMSHDSYLRRHASRARPRVSRPRFQQPVEAGTGQTATDFSSCACLVRPVIRANYALIKGLTVMGCRAGESVRMDPSLQAPRMAQLVKWVAEGKLRPHVSHSFDVTLVREAFLAVMHRKVTGKAVVTFGGDAEDSAQPQSRL